MLTQTRGVCVCVYVSQSNRENHPVPQEGGWEIEWPYIHKDMVGPGVSGPAQLERIHANQRGGGRWRMIPASASSQEGRTASEQGQGLQGKKRQHHILYGNEHVTMTLLLTSGSIHTVSL